MEFRKEHTLPDSWTLTALEDIGEGKNAIVDGPFGSNLKTSDYIDDSVHGVPVLTTKNLEGDYSEKAVRYISKEKYETLKRSQVNPGDIIVAKIGSIGKTGIYPLNARTAIIPANLLKFTVSKKVSFKYVFLYLNYRGFQRKLQSIATATAQPAFNVTKFRKLNIPLPPLDQQQAIVSKIEELFSELDKGIENLRLAQQQLKTYRQSVLKWAFEGKLTSASENVPGTGIEPNKVPRNGLEPLFMVAEEQEEYGGKLPKGWKIVALSELCQVKDGTHDTPKYVQTGIPFITQKNIRNDGLSFDDIKFISKVDHEKFYKRSNVTYGDILISMIGANRGLTCIVNDKRTFSIKNVGLIKASPEINATYLLYFLKSPFAWDYIKSLSKGGAQEFVGLTELRRYPIPYCSHKEQGKIVQEIESRLSVADKMEESINQSLQQSEALRQSILKKAFEGKLI